MDIVFIIFVVLMVFALAFNLFGRGSKRLIGRHRVGAESHHSPGSAGPAEPDHDHGESEYTGYGEGTR